MSLGSSGRQRGHLLVPHHVISTVLFNCCISKLLINFLTGSKCQEIMQFHPSWIQKVHSSWPWVAQHVFITLGPRGPGEPCKVKTKSISSVKNQKTAFDYDRLNTLFRFGHLLEVHQSHGPRRYQDLHRLPKKHASRDWLKSHTEESVMEKLSNHSSIT